MLELIDVHTHYGLSHVLQGVSLSRRRRRGGRPVRPQRRGQDHGDEDHRRLGGAERRHASASTATRSAASRRSASAAAASASCPKTGASSRA